MNDLAQTIYAYLRTRTPSLDPRVSYAMLVEQPGIQPFEVRARDPRLDAALGEIVLACRAQDLPPLACIVVHDDPDDPYPGRGYFRVAHPGAGENQDAQLEAWIADFDRTRRQVYPERIW